MNIVRFAVTASIFIAAFALSGCAIQRSEPASQKVSSIRNDLNYCIQSDDGRSVTCGKSAPFCLESKDHSNVACGGLAQFCAKSGAGETVACGGMAPFCEKSKDGKKVACGGEASFCESLRMGAARPVAVKHEDSSSRSASGRILPFVTVCDFSSVATSYAELEGRDRA